MSQPPGDSLPPGYGAAGPSGPRMAPPGSAAFAPNGGGGYAMGGQGKAPNGQPWPNTLRELNFIDVYIPEAGTQEYLMRGHGMNGLPLTYPPTTVALDIRRLAQIVMDRYAETKQREFAVEFDSVHYRVARIRAVGGAWYAVRKGVMRVRDFDEIGLPPRIREHLSMIGRAQTGLLLISGATGSGKTTTASALVKRWLELYGDTCFTIEDPCEHPLTGKHGASGRCWQIPVENGDFATPMREVLRFSPRFLMLGECRDVASASTLIRGSMTGHVCVSTIHASHPIEALMSLVKLAAASDANPAFHCQSLSQGLLGVVHQRLDPTSRRMETTFLFAGVGAGDQVRNKIREGRFDALNAEVDTQMRRIQAGHPIFA